MKRRHAALAAVGLVAGCAHRQPPEPSVRTATLAPLADETAPMAHAQAEPFTTTTAPTTTSTAAVAHESYDPPIVAVVPVTPGGVSVSVTAYCQAGTMADGNHTHSGAAASNSWPFGTRITVPGWGTVTVEDRVGHGSDLDLFTPSCTQAIDWGRRQLVVQVAA